MRKKSARAAHQMFVIGFAVALFVAAPLLHAQAASRLLGTVTAINGDLLTVKPAQSDAQQVQVPSTAQLKRVEPGQTSLSSAVDMQFSELAVGDRVLVNLDPNATGSTPQALRVIAIKAEDVAKRQQAETEAWQHGVGGLVKSVDASSGAIVLATGAGPTLKVITVHTTPKTVLERYAPASESFTDAKPAPISAIQPGDQLRARGTKNEEGTEITADAVVSGSFRNISGTIQSIDAASSTLSVKDLLTKKPVTVHITPQVQMRRLPERMAQMLAARLKGMAAGGPNGGGRSPQGEGGPGGGPGGPGGQGGPGGPGGTRGNGDMQQLLSRAPAIQLSDLQKGEAVMLVSTQGTSEVTAITLLAGVEPLLEAPASQDLLSNWSMGSGGAEEAAQ
ncbi:MAG TPA: DUF5666 domain-containing protein [Terracidiphilus sp.]|nr:DUF5666 domain-containing protein [Terracidiphilus sp.]